MENYLKATTTLNYNHPNFDAFLKDVKVQGTAQQKAIDLYFYVRDAFLYDPYHLDLRPDALIASSLLLKKRAWCVEKAIVLAAVARRYGIPSRLGYAIVTNHIGVERLLTYLRRPEIVFHGYVELYIGGRWIKCTPAFDKRICKVSGVTPLDWDGVNDSLFQPFEGDKQFMEYLHDYGSFEDVPVELMNQEMRKYYPHLFEESYNSKEFSFFHID